MKKVFLSLAVVAALTVVSCKQAEANAEEATTDSTMVEETPEATMTDSTATMADSTATTTEEAPATEAPAAQ